MYPDCADTFERNDMHTIAHLLEDQVKDLYSAENQLIKALPKVIRKASDAALKESLTAHLAETKGHAARMADVAATLGFKPGGKKCKAMEGLIEEGKEVLEEEGDPGVIDLGLIAACLRIEAYEIAAYTFAADIARRAGHADVAKMFEATLEDERNASDTLQETAVDVEPAKEEGENGDADARSANQSRGRVRAGMAGSVKRPRTAKKGRMGRARAVRALS